MGRGGPGYVNTTLKSHLNPLPEPRPTHFDETCIRSLCYSTRSWFIETVLIFHHCYEMAAEQLGPRCEAWGYEHIPQWQTQPATSLTAGCRETNMAGRRTGNVQEQYLL